MDKIIFNMATFPARIKALEESVPKILAQCDELHIYLNNYKDVPAFLAREKKIITYLSDEHIGDMGDCGKFYNCDNWHNEPAYIFTCDDKILYPPDYVKKMIDKIEEYQRKAVVSFHGRLLHTDRPSKSYYFDAKLFRGCLGHAAEDMFVHEIGTGVMAFHNSTIPKIDAAKFNKLFPLTNMTDIYFSIWLQKLKIPMLNPARKEAWLKISRRHDDNLSIHAMCNTRDKVQTDLINSVKWTINKI